MSSNIQGQKAKPIALQKIFGFVMLTVFFSSIFLLVTIPFEIRRTLDARTWESVPVKIIDYPMDRDMDGLPYSRIRIQDLEKNTTSMRVQFRYGDFGWNVYFFYHRVATLDTVDQRKYPPGTVVEAFRSPDGREYVLEQNSLNTMLTLFVLSCIYPGIAVVSIIRSQKASNKRERFTS